MSADATAFPAPRVDLLAVAAAGVTLCLWASGFVGIRAAGDDFSPGALALGRVLAATVVLGTMVALRREALPRLRDLPPVVACGLLWFTGYFVALNAAERRVDAGTAALLVNVGPILIALLGGLLLGEGFPRALFAGAVVAFAGVALIGTATSDHAAAGGWGVVLCLLAALGYSGGVIAQKVALCRVSALQLNFLCAATATLALTPASPSLVRELGTAPASSIGWVAYLGVFPIAVAFSTWTYALARTTAGRLASTTYLVPAISILLGWAFLGETPPALAFLGGAICLAGVATARNGIGARPLARRGRGSGTDAATAARPLARRGRGSGTDAATAARPLARRGRGSGTDAPTAAGARPTRRPAARAARRSR